MVFLVGDPDIHANHEPDHDLDPHRALVGSIGALAFIFALLCMP